MPYALIKDGMVINIIAWDGPGENGENEMDFGEGVTYVHYNEGDYVGPGFSYEDGLFLPPPPPEQSHEEMVAYAGQEKRQRVSNANSVFLIWQTKLLLNRATEEEKAILNQWVDYVDKLQAIDVQDAPDIDWPEQPSIPDSGR